MTHLFRCSPPYSTAALLLVPTLAIVAAGHAHAATTRLRMQVLLEVSAPNCRVTSENASVLLPAAASPTVTMSQYLARNGITTPGVRGGSLTSPGLNQVTTVTCDAANTVIPSIVVQPAPGSTLASGQALAVLTDNAPTPLKLASGAGWIGFEQVSVNATPALAAYFGSDLQSITPYVGGITTGPLNDGVSTAQFVWRPVFFNSSQAIGQPAGGQFTGRAEIIVHYSH